MVIIKLKKHLSFLLWVVLLAMFAPAVAQRSGSSETGESTDRSPAFKHRFWGVVEGGAGWQTVNDVEIPYQNATRFSLVDFDKGPFLVYRFYLGYEFKRHMVRALAAPLTVKVTGIPAQDISFQQVTFAAGLNTTGYYRFNSYRLTYGYSLVQKANLVVKAGFTGKIRDAEIRLENQFFSAYRDNIGFVPLLYLGIDLNLYKPFWFVLDVDALWSPYGRAEDVALKFQYRASSLFFFDLGYRMVEGGAAGGGNVYNFAWLHYALFAVRVNIQ